MRVLSVTIAAPAGPGYRNGAGQFAGTVEYLQRERRHLVGPRFSAPPNASVKLAELSRPGPLPCTLT